MPSTDSAKKQRRFGELTPVIWVLAGLLTISCVMLLLARSSTVTMPSIVNPDPSGLAAFAELVRADGYAVSLDRSKKPHLKDGDLAIACLVPKKTSPMAMLNEEDSEDRKAEKKETVGEALATYARKGGKLLMLRFPMQFDTASVVSANAATVTTSNRTRTLQITRNRSVESSGQAVEPAEFTRQARSPVYRTADSLQDVVAESIQMGSGSVIVADGMGSTNRFLGKNENAVFALELIHRLARPGTRVVFTEASFGNIEDKGILETLGPWAVTARWQLIFLLIVCIYTLGRRFGMPVYDVVSRRGGTRELVDAMSSVMRRGQKAGFALQTLAFDVLELCRERLRVPKSAPKADLVARLPIELRDALDKALRIAYTEPGYSEAARQGRAVMKAYRSFERDCRDRERR